MGLKVHPLIEVDRGVDGPFLGLRLDNQVSSFRTLGSQGLLYVLALPAAGGLLAGLEQLPPFLDYVRKQVPQVVA